MMKLMYLVMMVLLATLSGCSLLFDVTECSTNEECQAVAGEGEFLVCENNRCIAGRECVSRADCAMGEICSNNRCIPDPMTTMDMGPDLTDEDMTPDMVVPDMDEDMDPGIPCAHNLECDDNSLCMAGQCVVATSDECPAIVKPMSNNPNYVILGTILPTAAPFQAIGEPFRNGIQMAITELNDQGFPGRGRIVWVQCDDRGSPDLAEVAGTHLASLGTKAIVGPIFSTAFIRAVTEVAVPNEIFFMGPSATAVRISTLVDDGLAFRTAPTDLVQGAGILDRVRQLDAARCGELGQSAGCSSAVMLRKDDDYGAGLDEIAGPPLAQYLETGNLYRAAFPSPPFDFVTNDVARDQYLAMITDIVVASITDQPQANYVILLGTSETRVIVQVYLTALATNFGVPPEAWPTFIVSHGGLPDLPDAVTALDDTIGLGFPGVNFQEYMEGTSPNLQNQPNALPFYARYNQRYQTSGAQIPASLAYDAAAATLLAIAAVPQEEELTGPAIAAGVARLVDKDATVVNFRTSTSLSEARQLLASGQSIDIEGTTGNLDFDLNTGDVFADTVGWDVMLVQGSYEIVPIRIYTEPPGVGQRIWVPIP